MKLSRRRGFGFLTLYIITLCCQTTVGLMKFPGVLTHDQKPKAEDVLFIDTMNSMLQPGDSCNVNENEAFLKNIEEWLKKQTNVEDVSKEFKSNGGKVCRYDLSVCDEVTTQCECNANAAYDEKSQSCRIRIGWPCTDGEAVRQNQCVPDAICKASEGSYAYDTEMFPTASEFITDPGVYYCRCSSSDYAECGGAGDDTPQATKTVKRAGQANISDSQDITCASISTLMSNLLILVLYAYIM